MKPIKIKPCKFIHLGLMIWSIVLFTIVFELLAIFLSKSTNDILIGNLIILVICIVILLGYIIVRIFYQSYILINDNEIIKYERNKIKFKIEIKDIIEFGCRKKTLRMYFLLPFSYIFGDPMCDILSIRFKQAEITSERVYSSHFVLQTLTKEEKENGLKEYCECLTQKEINLICKRLNKPLIEVDLSSID